MQLLCELNILSHRRIASHLNFHIYDKVGEVKAACLSIEQYAKHPHNINACAHNKNIILCDKLSIFKCENCVKEISISHVRSIKL